MRDSIIDVGCLVAQHGGLESLSFRRVASELGCHVDRVEEHFGSHQELVGALIDRVFSRLEFPESSADPQERIFEIIQVLKQHYEKYSWVITTVAAGKNYSKAMLPIVESILQAYHQAGVTGLRAFWAYRTVWSYMIGALTIKTPKTGESAQMRKGLAQELSIEKTPLLLGVLPELGDMENDCTFEEGLRATIAGTVQYFQQNQT